MDISTTFFYGKFEEDIYVIQPIGLEDRTEQIYKLENALYSLKQAFWIWIKQVQKLQKNYGYIPFDSISSVYHRRDSKLDHQIIIAFYIDDISITSNSTTEILFAKSMLNSNFWIVELGPGTYYLGMTITQNW